MKKISHLVLTRFNLAIHFGCEKRADSKCPDVPWLNEEYLNKRFEIFEKWTFPSLQNQTDQDFKWIVLFHENTPNRFKQRIESYMERMDNFEAWYLSDSESDNFEDIIYQYIKTNYFFDGLITTRIDNDDLIHERFIESVKKDFTYENAIEVLSYQNGLQYDSKSKTLLKYNYVNNHFLSLYSSAADGEINHILQFNHALIDEYISKINMRKLVLCKKVPLWVEIITELNYSNRVKWRLQKVLVPKSYEKEYGLLELWKGNGSYIYSISKGIAKVFVNCARGIILRVAK